MITVCLRDGCFPYTASVSAADDTLTMRPKSLIWDRSPGTAPLIVYTDLCLAQVLDERPPRAVAWLIEPPSISPDSYDFVREHRSAFAHVLNHQRTFCADVGGIWYPFGGTRIAATDWQLWPKYQDVVIIASDKRKTAGHQLRHAVIRDFPSVCAYGPSYTAIGATILALRNARYAVVIENERSADWFTEKVIDCLATGTIPLYWSGVAVHRYFDSAAIWCWHTLDELASLLERATVDAYAALLPAIRANQAAAQAYRCTEDWMMEHIPEVFTV